MRSCVDHLRLGLLALACMDMIVVVVFLLLSIGSVGF